MINKEIEERAMKNAEELPNNDTSNDTDTNF